MREHKRRFIWFCSTEYVAEHPDSLEKLRDEIGLTTIMPESHICHTSGFRASDEIAARGPFEDWRSRAHLSPKINEGIYPAVAGTVGGFDDAPLLKVIDAARNAELEIWGHIGLWSYGGEVFPEYAMKDVEGNALDMRYHKWGIGLCPSNRVVNDWTRECLVDVIGRYDIDGFDVDHARFPAPANISSLFGCACESCAEAATRLGFEFKKMREGMLNLKNRLKTVQPAAVEKAFETGLAWEHLESGSNGQFRNWLSFRATLLADWMREFRDAVQAAAGEDKVFGSDVWPPSVALLGGHDYALWEQGADYLTGGSSAGGVVGWATTVTNLAGEWASFLCKQVSGLEEQTALRLVFQMFDYEKFELPDSKDGIQKGPLPLERMYEFEVEKLKNSSSGNLPLYPPISASGDAVRTRKLCEAVAKNGCDGALFTLDPENAETLKVIREVFGK
ncbi:MAG: hypothetical protein O3B01_02070 [Planctomycetota bacterium]|nr:hypothetical protein [Planctomycetota bacterium]MDA1137344.1 hypothetical protein [Planctomycetota bacterium]